MLTAKQIMEVLTVDAAQRATDQLVREGVPNSWKALFAAGSRREAERLVAAMETDCRGFARLICGADALGFRHRVKSVQHVPPELAVSEAERLAFAQSPPVNPGEKLAPEFLVTIRKLISMFEAPFRQSQRKVLTAHLFEKAAEWHFVYFDARDAYRYAKGHGKIGKHLHYGSHLFNPNLSAEEVWATLDARRVRLTSAHIRLCSGIG